MSAKNWQGQEGLSSDCKLQPDIALAMLMGDDEHPCDRCNIDRAQCRGFPRKPSHAAMMDQHKVTRGQERADNDQSIEALPPAGPATRRT